MIKIFYVLVCLCRGKYRKYYIKKRKIDKLRVCVCECVYTRGESFKNIIFISSAEQRLVTRSVLVINVLVHIMKN